MHKKRKIELSGVDATYEQYNERISETADAWFKHELHCFEDEDKKGFVYSLLWDRLYDHQRIAVQFLWRCHVEFLGALIADEMGLGKTLQVIAFIAALMASGELGSLASNEDRKTHYNSFKQHPILIVCPVTLIPQWINEFSEFFPLMLIVVSGNPKWVEVVRLRGGVVFSSYEYLRIHAKQFYAIDWYYVFLDEAQKIRNPHAQVTVAIKRLPSNFRVALSGSPIQNDLQELWSLMDFVQPGILGTLPIFNKNFVGPIMKGGAARTSSSLQSKAYACAKIIRTLIGPHILRRRKETLNYQLKLPEKTQHIIRCPLSITQFHVYSDFLISHDVSNDISRAMLSRKRHKGIHAKSLLFISVLGKICNHPDLLLRQTECVPRDYGNPVRSGKLKCLIELLRTWKSTGNKVLVFSQTIQMLNIIENNVPSSMKLLRLDGRVPSKERLDLVNQFNDSTMEIDLMILTTRVGGVGLNLVGASRVVLFDPDWNPTVDDQAQERSWRIGQLKKVAVYRLVSEGTLEEHIYRRQIFKQFLSQKVLDGNNDQNVLRMRDFLDLFAFPPIPEQSFDDTDPLLRNTYSKVLAAWFNKLKSQKSLKVVLKEEEESFSTTGVLPGAESDNEEGELIEESNAETIQDEPAEQTAQHLEESLLSSLFAESSLVASVVTHKDQIEEAKQMTRTLPTQDRDNALFALLKSRRDREAYAISEPTWTGREGKAGRPIEPQKNLSVKGRFKDINELSKVTMTENVDSEKEKKILLSLYNAFEKTEFLKTGDILEKVGPFVGTEKQKFFLKSLMDKLTIRTRDTNGNIQWQLKDWRRIFGISEPLDNGWI